MKRILVMSIFTLLVTCNGMQAASQKQADLNQKLYKAVESGNLEDVKRLVKEGADINARDPLLGLTPLSKALTKNDINIIDYLLNNKADIYVKDKGGDTL